MRLGYASLVLAGFTGVLSTRVTSKVSSEVGSCAENTEPYLGAVNETVLTEEGESSSQGKILINEDGVRRTYYLPGAEVIQGGTTVRYYPGKRFYLMKRPTTNYKDAWNFYKPRFLGKTFSVDINYGPGGAGCGCNLNFYLVDMPVASPGRDGDYYCGSQCKPHIGCCVEFDMYEGNAMATAITNHACTGDYSRWPHWECHRWGDPVTKTKPSQYAPGYGHTIDTNRRFTFSQRFDVLWGGRLKVTTTLTQDGRRLPMTMGPDNSQLNVMKRSLEKGLAFVTGYWMSERMNWLDGAACGQGPESCNKRPALISNWRITSNR